MMAVLFRGKRISRLNRVGVIASALLLSTAPGAWASYVQKVTVTGGKADEVGVQQISFTPTTGSVVDIQQEDEDDDDISIFLITLSDDATSQGAIKIGDQEIETPAIRRGDDLSVNLDGGYAYATLPSQKPVENNDGSEDGPFRGFGIYAGPHIEEFDTETPIENGTLVIDSGGVFSDAGLNPYIQEGALVGFKAGASYQFLGSNLSATFTHATANDEFSSASAATGPNEAIGFAFYGVDSEFGTGIGGLTGTIDATGQSEIALDRFEFDTTFPQFDIFNRYDHVALFPAVGFTHTEIEQTFNGTATLNSPFGTLTQVQSVWQLNEFIGPDFGVEFTSDIGANNCLSLSLKAEYQPRWNTADISAQQNVDSQIGFFPASVQQSFDFNETRFFHGYQVHGSISYALPFLDHVSVGLEGGFRHHQFYQFGQQSDGLGRPALAIHEEALNLNGSAFLRLDF